MRALIIQNATAQFACRSEHCRQKFETEIQSRRGEEAAHDKELGDNLAEIFPLHIIKNTNRAFIRTYTKAPAFIARPKPIQTSVERQAMRDTPEIRRFPRKSLHVPSLYGTIEVVRGVLFDILNWRVGPLIGERGGKTFDTHVNVTVASRETNLVKRT